MYVTETEKAKQSTWYQTWFLFKVAINSPAVFHFQSEYGRENGVAKFLLCFYQNNDCMKQEIVTVLEAFFFSTSGYYLLLNVFETKSSKAVCWWICSCEDENYL